MKYQRKPVIIEAFQFHAGTGPQAWPEGWLDAPHSIIGDGHCRVWCEEHRVNLRADDGTWIIKDEQGRFHITSDEYFHRIYEPVKENV